MYKTRTQARRFVIGLAAIAVLALVGYVALTANQGRLPGTPAEMVRADFTDVGQLQVGSEVRQRGVHIGQVSDISLVDGRPRVTMTVNGGESMYRNGYAGIWDQSALAQKYVELSPGDPSSGPLGDGVLPTQQTEPTHDLQALLDVFDPKTRSSLGSSLREMGNGLAGRGPALNGFFNTLPGNLRDVSSISTALTAADTDLPGLLKTTDRLTGRFNGREQQISSLLSDTAQTLQALNTDHGHPLDASLRELPAATDALDTAFRDADGPLNDLATATGELRPGAAALGTATPDLRGVLREGPEPLNKVPDVADDAKPAIDDLSDTFQAARPFAGKTADALTSAAQPLGTLAPYSRDVGTLFNNLGHLITNHDGWEHRLHVGAALTPGSFSPQLPDTADPYPAPGQATRDRDPNGGLVPNFASTPSPRGGR